MKCPVCRATYRNTPPADHPEVKPCHRCGADLAPLIQLHDRAIHWHRNAIAQFKVGDLLAAITSNNQAIALHSQHPKFHAFAGQLWAVKGDFKAAVRSWKVAQQLDPKDTIVSDCLAILEKLKQ
jgi:predicted negative regulator of RcsB-dependent stress response